MSSEFFGFMNQKSGLPPGAESGTELPPGIGPLAHRIRPLKLDHFLGQMQVLGPGKPLRRWIENDQVPSLILWGPPGCGKTTLAHIIAERTQSRFEALSAVLSGIKDIKECVEQARQGLIKSRQKTILFVDEIHRFNKSQQDALLPHVEKGVVTLIGATTENPSFELNSALLSRTRVIRLDRLSPSELQSILQRALQDPEKGLGGLLKLTEQAIEWISQTSEGDARRALTALETVSLFSAHQNSTDTPLGIPEVQSALESSLARQPIPYDKKGEEHYNVISAFIKSIRDSDPHAGLYYLARMLTAGEDPLLIARRLVVLASEDIGNADPRALSVALGGKDAVDFLGMPECRISLAQVVTYLAMAPKSNASYVGISEALAEIEKSGGLPVPFHLRNAVTSLMRGEGYGQGYRYAHSEKGSVAVQTHLPELLLGTRFYRPGQNVMEKQIAQRLDEHENTAGWDGEISRP